MAKVDLSSVVTPESVTGVLLPYVNQTAYEKGAIISSGIATTDNALEFPSTHKVRGGKVISVPMYKRLTAGNYDDEVLNDASALTVQGIGTGYSTAAIHARGNAWSVNDLAGYVAGSDPLVAIGDMVNEYWASKAQKVLLSTLKGVFDSASMSGSLNDISGKSGDDGKVSSGAMIDTIYALGDKQEGLTAVMMNSAVMKELVKQNLISTVRDAEGKILYSTYLEKRVIVDDALEPISLSSGKKAYELYFFGNGAFSYTIDTENTAMEMDRDILAGDTVMAMRRYFVMHPRGMSWIGTSAGFTPTNAELEVGTNWDLADNRKNVAITKLVARID